jgi:hypothetical protein
MSLPGIDAPLNLTHGRVISPCMPQTHLTLAVPQSVRPLILNGSAAAPNIPAPHEQSIHAHPLLANMSSTNVARIQAARIYYTLLSAAYFLGHILIINSS